MFLNLAEELSEHKTLKAVFPPVLNVSRRGFMSGATGLTLGIALTACTENTTKTPIKEAALIPDNSGIETGPLVLISIATDGRAQITNPRSEMGQQVITTVVQMIADELDIPWDKIEVAQAVGHPKYGDQNTDGSTSVRNHFTRFRMGGASMRHMLVQAAANEWGVDIAECSSSLGVITHSSGKTLSYGDVAEAAGRLDVPAEADIKLKDRKDWRYIGQDKPSYTIPKVIQGEGTFGIDVRVPDMLYAVIARPPQLFSKVKTINEAAALAVPGVSKIIKIPDPKGAAAFQPLGGVAVIATDTWAAIQGREALQIEWEDGPNANYDSIAFRQELRSTARKSGTIKFKRGDVDKTMKNAAKTITAEYYAPHLSQSPMEPPAATARWIDNKVECWACVQAPQAARRTVAAICGIPEDNVTINVTWLGGGFGRKSKPDFVVEAALIAREVGAPVKVTWTREDDVRHGYFHSVSAQRIEAALDKDGKTTAVLHRTVFPSINSTFAEGADEGSDFELSLGATDNPWNVPNMQVEVGKAKAHIRIGWLRSVANVYHVFATQSFAGELAHAAGKDQKDYLLELIGPDRIIDFSKDGVEYPNYGSSIEDYPVDTARLKATLSKAASMAKWGRNLPKGHGLGIAVHRSFLSYVATAIEVKVDTQGRITFPGIWCALDAGTVVSPDNTKAQMEGGTLFGISNALYGEITAKNGAVQQANFPDWRVMRMAEAPGVFETHIMESTAPPGGVGEPGTPPAAPALANAIFAATGQRHRMLPILGQRDTLDMKNTGEG